MEETERQWGNPRGQQGVTVMTQQKARGVCLDILFHNCHSKQTLEKNLLFIQREESRNANRLLNTEKIIHFQHSYHYHPASAISGVKEL